MKRKSDNYFFESGAGRFTDDTFQQVSTINQTLQPFLLLMLTGFVWLANKVLVLGYHLLRWALIKAAKYFRRKPNTSAAP